MGEQEKNKNDEKDTRLSSGSEERRNSSVMASDFIKVSCSRYSLPLWPYHLKMQNIITTWNDCLSFILSNRYCLKNINLYWYFAFCATSIFLAYRAIYSFSAFGCILIFISMLAQCLFLLKAWLLVQPLKKDFSNIMTPQALLHRCFIPGLNLYWVLIAFSSLEAGLKIIATLKRKHEKNANKHSVSGYGMIVPYLLLYQYATYFIDPAYGQNKPMQIITGAAVTIFYVSCKLLVDDIICVGE